jgi:uncharacterized protein YdeI (YjbR/CyaY-like superfamily)
VNWTRRESVWLVTFKKVVPEFYLPYDAIVEELICFGWIDGRVGKVDAERSKLLISPRKSGSGWSRVNKERVQKLEASGLLAEPGRRAIADAQADGTWSRLDQIEDLVKPADFALALDGNPIAAANWESFPRSVKRGQLESLLGTKSEEARMRKIGEILRYAEFGLRFGFPGEKAKLEARLQDGAG